MDGTREELLESLKVDVDSMNLTNLKNSANNTSNGSASGGVSGSIAGHGAEGSEDRSI